MENRNRISWLYDLARAQTDHEQQISAELSTRAGLLVALAALIAVGLSEMRHYVGGSILLAISCALLAFGVGFLFYSAWGIDYQRVASAKKWSDWARKEDSGGRCAEEVTAELIESICLDYCESAQIGIEANNKKSPRLNTSACFLLASLLCLILAIFLGSIQP